MGRATSEDINKQLYAGNGKSINDFIKSVYEVSLSKMSYLSANPQEIRQMEAKKDENKTYHFYDYISNVIKLRFKLQNQAEVKNFLLDEN